MDFPPPLIERLRTVRRIVVFTGAGVSAESGIPTYRDKLTGLWERFDPEDLDTRRAFKADPELVWGWYEWRRRNVMQSEPNAAHRAIAAMANHVPELTVVTQNIDDLHERAGSVAPVHLHGTLFQPRCIGCARPHALPPGMPDEVEQVVGYRLAPPRCGHCGGRIRPGVVWFGERLPRDVWRRADMAVRRCEVILCIGTSSVVYPAAELPLVAARRGAVLVQINPESTGLERVAQFNLAGQAGEVMPALFEAVWAQGQPG